MKIAVASEGNLVTEHFGHCENYNIYVIKDKEVTEEHNIPNPGHKPGFLPRFLGDMKVNIIISGGMGNKAVEIFNKQGIEVVIGASGDAKQSAIDYALGKLKSTGTPCVEDQHKDKCKD